MSKTRSEQMISLPEHTNHTSATIIRFEQFCGYSYIFLSLIGTFTNILAMTIFLDFQPCKKGRKLLISTALFLHLASCDLMTSLFVLPFNGFAFLNKTHKFLDEPFRTMCTISGVFFNICSRQSCNIFALISFVRCVAIVRPFKHAIWFTKFRINLVLGITWAISILMSTMVFMLGKSYRYNDYVTLCTWTLDDLGMGAGNVGKDWRSVLFFFLVVLPIFLPVTFTFICLTVLIVYFSRNSKNRDKVRVSLADMVEISEGFAQAMKNMLDSKQKLRRSFRSQESTKLKERDKKDGVIYQTMRKIKSRNAFLHLSENLHEQDEDVCKEIQAKVSQSRTSLTMRQHDQCPDEDFDQYGGVNDIFVSLPLNPVNGINQDNNTLIPDRIVKSDSSISELEEHITPQTALTPKPGLSKRLVNKITKRFQKDTSTKQLSVSWRKKAVTSQSHAFVTLIVIGTTFVLCYSLWCFFFFCGFLATINPSWYILSLSDGDTIILTMTTAILLINLSSCSTPCIHITRGNNLRNKLKSFGKSSKIVEKGSKILESLHG